ncbi:hypothetical protein BC940DRAFT_286928 [Gongronella butleri]|nr:hypothetical protein BC940DRAFT_286928 [Gongronella butleri]
MNPAPNAGKEWPLSQGSAMPGSLHDHPANYSPTPTMAQPYPPYGQGSMMAPPTLHSYSQPPPHMHTTSYMKSDSDPRLPGMMMLSQPSTPRPNNGLDDNAAAGGKKQTRQYVPPYTPSMNPYPVLPRKQRPRSDNGSSLFGGETSPSFSAAKPLDNLFSPDRANLLTVRIQSKMDRGFFLADNDWTCYRRNYFQVSSTFSIHGLNPYYGDHELQCFVQTANHGTQPVARFLVGISSRVSTNDKPVELVQHTPKRDKGPQMTPMAKQIVPGGNLSLSSVGSNQSIATFERIQFKTATANNGKRRAAQQYYVIVVELYAETHDQERVLVASSVSSPLVVRGRSPGHYADNQTRAHAPPNAAPVPTPPGASMPPGMMMPPHVDDDRYHHAAYSRANAPPTGAPMMPPDYQHYYYATTASYPANAPPAQAPAPYPPNMLMHSDAVAPPPPSGPATSNAPQSAPNASQNTSSPTQHHQQSLSDPSSSESSSPDAPSSANVIPDSKVPPHPSQISIQAMPNAVDGSWSRSRYHSAGSVPSPAPNGDQPSYFSPQQQAPPNGAPPTPTTPFIRKFDPLTAEQTS